MGEDNAPDAPEVASPPLLSSDASAASAIGESLGKLSLTENSDGTRDNQSLPLRPAEPDCSYYLNDGGFSSADNQSLPLRPAETDCTYYLKTGSCGYGTNCRFNHPPVKCKQGSSLNHVEQSQVVRERDNMELSEMTGSTECKFYLSPGGCKYGNSCRYNHFREKNCAEVELNFTGLPIRPGMKECPFYMRTGSCQFSTNCRYHHPNPAGGSNSSPRTAGHAEPELTSSTNAPISFLNSSSSFREGCFLLPHQIFHLANEYHPSQAFQIPDFPPESTVHTQTALSYSGLNKAFDLVKKDTEINEFPERPGEPECSYFMKFGFCKFKLACKFHHPKNRLSKSSISACTSLGSPLRHTTDRVATTERFSNTSPASAFRSPTQLHGPLNLNDNDYPTRPGEPSCHYFMKHGDCKFKSACKYNHPKVLFSSQPYNTSPFIMPIGHQATGYPVVQREWRPHALQTSIPKDEAKLFVLGRDGGEISEYPERLGEPVCHHFIKTGDCKFKSACKYHHPKDQSMMQSPLTPLGLPIREGQPICTFYSRFGICKYGPSCRFNHPLEIEYSVPGGCTDNSKPDVIIEQAKMDGMCV